MIGAGEEGSRQAPGCCRQEQGDPYGAVLRPSPVGSSSRGAAAAAPGGSGSAGGDAALAVCGASRAGGVSASVCVFTYVCLW